MDKVAKLEFLLMAFIQKLVRLTEVAKSLVTFLISLPFFPSSLYVWYDFIDISREAGGGEMWGFLVQGEALLTSVVQLAEELAGYVYWRSYVEGSFSYLVFQDHDSFHDFSWIQYSRNCFGIHLAVYPNSSCPHRMSCKVMPIVCANGDFYSFFSKI